ncbi:hypothetical protein OEZ85_002817 [Tetradesmus obliquus]|uniref:Cilia- and flagella-associated protein 206 n=1 Tax=Tetradesmus obliquus TaxID=3088 RepID=A0ABY8U3N2_TETOB|nr:hypothetical protein OEZ85_002817 [Tetradesmus obliquus]
MAEKLAQQVLQSQDPAAAATAQLQLTLERSYKQQQDKVEAEQAQHVADANRLAAAVAYRKVNLQIAGLQDYQSVFEGVVDYVCCVMGVAARAKAEPAASAQVSAAVESAFPLSGVAYFLTLPAQQRLQQAAVSLRRLAADLAGGISCCHALDEGVAAALAQASQVVSNSVSGVAKAAVFPLFESAGRLHLALTGELRLLLVRARLWEDACAALSTAASDSAAGVPRVLGFKGPRAGRQSCGFSCTGQVATAAGVAAVGAAACSALSEAEAASLPASMQYVPPGAAAAAAADKAHGAEGAAEGEAAGQLALAGMCPVSIAGSVAAGAGGVPNGDGSAVLVAQLANPAVECVRYGGSLYGFSCTAALQAFADAPATTLDAVRVAVRNAPLLAHMLGLPSMAAAEVAAGPGAASRVGSAGSDGSRASSRADGSAGGSANGGACAVLPLRRLMALLSAAAVKVDAETQTPTHFSERHIDVNYEWNEWALRRRVIALANLRTKATHSAQTALSHFRRDGDSQTWQPKAAAAQTKVNKGSSMPRKLRYVAGLRGAPETAKMKVVALELDIGQTHQF